MLKMFNNYEKYSNTFEKCSIEYKNIFIKNSNAH